MGKRKVGNAEHGIPAQPGWIHSENPVCRALAMDEILRSGKVKNKAELARRLKIAKSRVTQLLSLLELGPSILPTLAKFDRLPKPLSERWLRGTLLKVEARYRGALLKKFAERWQRRQDDIDI